MKKLFFLLILFISLNIYLDHRAKIQFRKKHFPPNIIYPLKEDIKLPRIEEGVEIPKIIHRCYKDLEGIEKFKKVFDLTETRMPGYKQIYYTDELIDKYIEENYGERIYNAYKSINPAYGAARADFFRYLVVYKEGGIYMDIKTGPNKKIDNFFEKYKGKLLVSIGKVGNIWRFIPREHLKKFIDFGDDWGYITNLWPNSEHQQFIIASPKGNPILGKVIQQVVTNIEKGIRDKSIYSQGKYSVLAMTGPIIYSLVINKYKDKYKDKITFFDINFNKNFNHSLVDYKNIMKDKHYSMIKNKEIII